MTYYPLLLFAVGGLVLAVVVIVIQIIWYIQDRRRDE
jgi:hypothetical protein